MMHAFLPVAAAAAAAGGLGSGGAAAKVPQKRRDTNDLTLGLVDDVSPVFLVLLLLRCVVVRFLLVIHSDFLYTYGFLAFGVTFLIPLCVEGVFLRQ